MRPGHWWYTAPLRLKSIFRRRQAELELDEELQFHLEHKIEEGIGQGLTPDEARYRALRAMNGLEQRKEEMRDTRGVHWLTDFLDDTRYAVRSLRRTPGLAVFVVVTLALGIGMTTTPFSMLDALVFRPYPVPHPGSVVTLVSTSQDNRYDTFSYREYLDLRDGTASYDGVVANTNIEAVGFATDAVATPRVKGGMMVSGNFFQVLGVEPRLGRGFRADEDQQPGRNAVAVLGPGFFEQEFASDPGVVGRTIRLNGTDFTVIGVAPESFPGMNIFGRPDVYVPLAMAPLFSTNPQKRFLIDRDDRELVVRARLKAGTTFRQAQNELELMARRFERDYPQLNHDRGAALRTFLEMRTRGDDINWKFSVVFSMLALAVLLVACTNVAGLLLSRARTRTREIAVRLAMGAGRSRLVRLLLTESLILAAIGGLGGIVVGFGGIRFMQSFQIPAELPVTIPFRMDGRVLFAAFVVSLVSALICGLAPAWQSSRADLVTGLKSADVDVPGRKRLWGRNALVVAQVAMSLMLLTASFLMARGFQRGVLEGLGFPKDRLLLARFDPRLLQYDGARTARFYDQLVEHARELPGVHGATLTRSPPLDLGDAEAVAFVPDAFEMPRDRRSFTSTADTVDPAYFETLGIPIVRGRGFARADAAGAPPVAIVNEQFARHFWPDGDAVGKHLRLVDGGAAPVEIVGVAKTVKYRSTDERPIDFVYLPLAQHPVARLVLMIRASGDPLRLVQPVKDVVHGLDPNLPMLDTRTFDDLYRYHAVEGPRIAVELIGTMGAVGLLLAIAGLYGLLSYNVTRRTREIGIRMAIGAGPRNVLRLVMSKGIALVGIGTAIGLVLGFAVERLMNAMLFSSGGIDFVVYLVVVPSMLAVTLLAAYVPARRATSIPPTLALRCE